MYDVGVALRRFRGLIRYTARKYSVETNFRMSQKDLEAEGLLTLVQCCRAFPEGQIHFSRYFKRAWNNRLKKLLRFNMRKKRQGFEVNLELASELVAPTKKETEVSERIVERANVLYPFLSRDAKKFLQILIEPSGEVMETAWRDYCRKNKLHSQGVNFRGWKMFRIHLRHIREALSLSERGMKDVVQEIRRVNSKL